MKFREIFRFEFVYQMSRPYTWLFFAVVIFVAWLNTGDETLAEALYEDFFLNSPFAIAKTTVIGTLVWLVSAAVVAGAAGARDIETRMYPLTHTAPVSKGIYLAGKFCAAFCINALILVGVQAGIMLSIYLPGVNADAIGPFNIAAFLSSYMVISLPNAFAGTAIQFWLSTRSGRSTAGYFGSFFLFFMGFFVAALLLFYSRVGSWVDPIGIRFIIEDLAHLWTPTERKWRMLSLEGPVFWNRLFWITIGIISLIITYLAPRERWRRRQKATRSEHVEETTNPAITAPVVPRSFGFITSLHQTLALGWTSFRAIILSRAGLALTIGIPVLTLIVVYNNVSAGGVPRIPITALIIGEITAPVTAELSPWSILPLLILIFAGEIVWRERDARVDLITDSMPVHEWSSLLGKFLAIGLFIAMLMILLAVGGIISQLAMSYYKFEIDLYLKVLFGLQFIEYFLFAALIVVVHVIVNRKYIAHLVAIVVCVFIAVPKLFGIEHNLLIYNSGPMWTYSEMRGFGSSLEPWFWFKVYWIAWAFLLATIARPNKWLIGIAGTGVICVGSFIFYNTNILNEYLTDFEYEDLLTQYEQKYKRYEDVVQPAIAMAILNIDLHPGQRTADVHGVYELINESSSPIDTIHLATIPGAELTSVTFRDPSSSIIIDDNLGHRIYKLKDPIPPGESQELIFDLHIGRDGFGNHGVYASVVPNGTFFTSNDWLPSIGYQSTRELMKPTERKKHGLAPRPLIPSLYDSVARMKANDHLLLDITITTDVDQTAVAPGMLVKQWTDGQRKYFHYMTPTSVPAEYSIFSSKYSIREEYWRDVTIRLLYHPTHTANTERMIKSIVTSLKQYTADFGPYPYRNLTFVEVRGNEIGMHADASLVRFSEGTALWDPGDVKTSFDLPFSVVAHELAHQWWGHKMESAFVEGAPVLSESLAEYSAMRVVEQTYGRDQLRRKLAFMRQPFPYAPIRHGEPLLRAVDPYLAYRKAPFALHALGEGMGHDKVITAMRTLLDKHPRGVVPLPTTLDLYQELQAVTPDSLQSLLHDFFEVNTIWDLDAERATAKQNTEGKWEVSFEVKARKIVTDSAGVETDVPMTDWVQIGIFDNSNAPSYLQKHRLQSGIQTITVVVDSRPAIAAVDPYHVLDLEELEDDNNKLRVKIDQTTILREN